MDLRIIILLLFPLHTVNSQNVFVAAPSMIRLGIDEGVAIAVDGTLTPQHFNLYVQDHPGRRKNLSHTFVTIVPPNPKIVTIRIDPDIVNDVIIPDTMQENFVNLTISSNNFQKSMILPVSFKTGYVFIQTDKPIYTPRQLVKIRIIPLDEESKPSSEKLKVQIKNPKAIVVKEVKLGGKNFAKAEDYIYDMEYKFPPHPIEGNWFVTVLHGFKLQQNTTVQFELEEYVLPPFNVKLETPEVILPSHATLYIKVEANYFYGKPVDGSVSFRFGIKDKLNKINYLYVLPSQKLRDGVYSKIISTKELQEHSSIGWFPEIKDFRFVVEATVTSAATGEISTVVDASGQFSDSPFIISFKNCLEDFKPGLISLIEANVNYVSGKPASKIKAVISAKADNDTPLKITNPVSISDKEGRLSFEIQPEIHHTIVKIMVTSDDPNYPENQAVGHHIQNSFQSKNNAFIAITRKSKELPEPGKMFSEQLYVYPNTIWDIYFMVISKGKILLVKKLDEGKKYRIRMLQFMVSQEMVPSFRILAFAEYKQELISDSLLIDVSNQCDPKANVEIVTDSVPKVPGDTATLWIIGSKTTLVSLLAVDSAVYALSEKDRLTKSKMFKTFASHDLGCGPGGGLTTNSVLRNAGIVMVTRNYDGIAMVSACEENIRKKRAIISEKLNKHVGRLRECCALGLSHDVHNQGCTKRAAIVKAYFGEQDKNCSTVFLDCCHHAKEKNVTGMVLKEPKGGQMARIGGGSEMLEFVSITAEDKEEGFVIARTNFMESWMFDKYVLHSDGRQELKYTIPDSITTWIVQAIALSPDYGMCIAIPQKLTAFKSVFIKLNLPYSAVRNEQIEIQATVFNYANNNISVVVYMYGVKNLCTGSQEGEKSERKRLVIPPLSAQTATFPVIPLMHGTFDIKVVALSFVGSDIVIKKLHVVPEGELVEEEIPVILDPSNLQKRKRRDVWSPSFSDSIDVSQNLQLTTVELKVPYNFIPGTDSCVITAIGDQYGPTVQTAVNDPNKLINKPTGCTEQAMINLAPAIYTMRYLKELDKITSELETVGYETIRAGYDLVLTYRKDDGSFGAWKNTPSSTWLTAFVMKVFCQASHLIHIDEEVICSGMKWLISGLQEDGSFKEENPVYHTKMMGGVKGSTPLTAFVLISLTECTCNIPNIHIIRARALSYLEENVGNIDKPLPLAISAYALALMESELKHAINDKLLSLSRYDIGTNTLFWETESNSFNVEAAGYGLLTQILLLSMEKANSIVNWLNTQRIASGAFHSTQDTVIALQALSEYAARAKLPGLNLLSNVTSSKDVNILTTFQFDEKNSLVLQEYKINKLGGTLFVYTAGHGIGFMNVKLRYNIPTPAEKLRKFYITVNVTEEKDTDEFPSDMLKDDDYKFALLPDALIRKVNEKNNDLPPDELAVSVDLENFKRSRIGRPEPKAIGRRRIQRSTNAKNSNLILKLKICLRYLGDHEKGMTVVDAGIFSGFKPNEEDLKKLVENVQNTIDSYEITSRGVVFYLRQAPMETMCFDFRIIRDFIIGNTRSAIIKAYLYYDSDESSYIFYSPDQNSPMLRKICSAGICQCAEGGCPPKKPFAKIGRTRSELKLSACEKHDYVWIVKVLEPVSRKDGFLYISTHVKEVIKEGIEKSSVVQNSKRLFMARDNCETAELSPGKEYIILGKDGEKYENEKGEVWHRYILDQSSKVHFWTEVAAARNKPPMPALHWLRNELLQGCDL